jgi:hypothetical protein
MSTSTPADATSAAPPPAAATKTIIDEFGRELTVTADAFAEMQAAKKRRAAQQAQDDDDDERRRSRSRSPRRKSGGGDSRSRSRSPAAPPVAETPEQAARAAKKERQKAEKLQVRCCLYRFIGHIGQTQLALFIDAHSRTALCSRSIVHAIRRLLQRTIERYGTMKWTDAVAPPPSQDETGARQRELIVYDDI